MSVSVLAQAIFGYASPHPQLLLTLSNNTPSMTALNMETIQPVLYDIHRKLDCIIDLLIHGNTASTEHANDGIGNARPDCYVPSHTPEFKVHDFDKFIADLETEFLEPSRTFCPPTSAPTPATLTSTATPRHSASPVPSPIVLSLPTSSHTDLMNPAPPSATPSKHTRPIGSSSFTNRPPEVHNHKATLITNIKAMQRTNPSFNVWWHKQVQDKFGTLDPRRTPTAFLEDAVNEWQ